MTSILRLLNQQSENYYGHTQSYEDTNEGLKKAKMAFEDIIRKEIIKAKTIQDLVGNIRIQRFTVGKEDDDFVYTVEDYIDENNISNAEDEEE